MAVQIEVINDTSGFRHRLVAEDGRTTAWASYQQATYLDGVVAISPYFTGGRDMKSLTADEFCALYCVTAGI